MTNPNPPYMPYGAYELKATYQRNLLVANLITFSTVATILLAAFIAQLLQKTPDVVFVPPTIATSRDLPQPPIVTREKPQMAIEQPAASRPAVGIPTPVEDSLILDDNVVIMAPSDYVDYNPIDDGDGVPTNLIFQDDVEEYIPGPTEIVFTEIYPEFVHQVQPEYPRFAQSAGLEGTVHVKALVMPDGSVRDAMIFKPSGVKSLDEAALSVAKQNVFKPGIQNGRPVACWVVYRVEFELSQ